MRCGVARYCLGERALPLLLPLGKGARGRTIAGLDVKDDIGPEHVAEAIQYRSLDRAPRR